MKLRYYLRGLGVGIVVTAVIMIVAFSKKQPMTDEEVVKRAKELGMIENTIIKDVASIKEDDEQPNQGNSEEIKEEIKEEIQEEIQEEPDDEVTEVITVAVISGDSSWSVAKRMEEAGLIESAKEFDAFLCSHGYDKRISVGTYEIPKNATWEEMGKIINKMN